jgi:hypothetical protein
VVGGAGWSGAPSLRGARPSRPSRPSRGESYHPLGQRATPAKAKQVAICAHHQLNYIKTSVSHHPLSARCAPYRPHLPQPATRSNARRIPFHRHLAHCQTHHPPAPKSLPLPSPAVHTRITALLLLFLPFLSSSFRRRFPAEPDTTPGPNSTPS